MAHLAFWRALLFSIPSKVEEVPIHDQIEQGTLPPFNLKEHLKEAYFPQEIPTVHMLSFLYIECRKMKQK